MVKSGLSGKQLLIAANFLSIANDKSLNLREYITLAGLELDH